MLFCFVPSTPQSHVHTSISFYSSLSHFFTVPFKKLFLRHLTSHIFHTYICKNEINEENKMRSKKSSMAHNFHRNCSNRTESSTIFLKIKHFEYVSFRELMLSILSDGWQHLRKVWVFHKQMFRSLAMWASKKYDSLWAPAFQMYNSWRFGSIFAN